MDDVRQFELDETGARYIFVDSVKAVSATNIDSSN